MTTKKIQVTVLALFAGSALWAGCGDDGDGGAASDAGGNPAVDGSVEFVCDPVGANAEMNGLFNAPVEADVEIIEKQPQHPGNPGPTDLP